MHFLAPSLAITNTPQPTRSPAYEKMLIGPAMVLGELLTGGHYLEVLRLKKQTSASHHTYPSIHNAFVAETGFFGAFYRGFLPWGIIQTIKGLPVLFVQGEVQHLLEERMIDKEIIGPASGICAGAAQAVFVCPTQKLKVMVIEEASLNALPVLTAVKQIVKKNGVLCIYDGIFAMMLRRSMDWCIRFTVSHKVNDMYVEYKANNDLDPNLNLLELCGCGMVGGFAGSLTHPIDTIITNCQKPMPEGMKKDAVSVAKRIHNEFGFRGFFRAMGIKVIDNMYHVGWVYGVGTFVNQELKSWREENN